jgi:hypothetical protein
MERGRAIWRRESSTTAGKNIGLLDIGLAADGVALEAEELLLAATSSSAERLAASEVGGPFAVNRRQMRLRLAPLQNGMNESSNQSINRLTVICSDCGQMAAAASSAAAASRSRNPGQMADRSSVAA